MSDGLAGERENVRSATQRESNVIRQEGPPIAMTTLASESSGMLISGARRGERERETRPRKWKEQE